MAKNIIRSLSLLCALIMMLSMNVSVSAVGTDGLPKTWWDVWGPYGEAVETGNIEQIYKAGLAVEDLYGKYPLNADIANHLALVYDRLLETRHFENKSDYTGARDNTEKLIRVAQYLAENGEPAYLDSVIEGKAHLEVLGPFTGVYAASATKGSSYSSRIAPAHGTYYGSVFQGYLADSGVGSIASVYVELETETAEDFDYILKQFDDGKHVIEINLNYTKEGVTARKVLTGALDSNVNATLRCLATHNCPFVLRVGGEMNIWSDAQNPTASYVTPKDYIASYRYIADKARSICPKVEMVWSPMYSTRWGESFEDFYPGDSYVDWVGCSLYYNYDDKGYTEQSWLEHNRLHQYADPLLCAKNIAEFAEKHNKPVIATEGGAYKNGTKGEAYAAAQNAKAFAVVPMVYPQFKAIVYFDKNILEVDGRHDYSMSGTFRTVAMDAINSSPVLIPAGSTSAKTYIPLEQFNEKADKIVIGATGYTYNDTNMKVTYSLDGGSAVSGKGAANQYELTVAQLGSTAHTLKVTFTDAKGYTETKTYNITASNGTIRCGTGAAAPATPAAPTTTPVPTTMPTVVLSPQKLAVDGETKTTEIYNIGGTNYFKLRDLAALLNGSSVQFNVDFNSATNTIVVKTKTPYTTANGYELQSGVDNSALAKVSAQSLEIDGKNVPLTAYNIGGTNFFGLRQLEQYIGYSVGYISETNTATISTH